MLLLFLVTAVAIWHGPAIAHLNTYGTHERFRDNEPPDKVRRRWYSLQWQVWKSYSTLLSTLIRSKWLWSRLFLSDFRTAMSRFVSGRDNIKEHAPIERSDITARKKSSIGHGIPRPARLRLLRSDWLPFTIRCKFLIRRISTLHWYKVVHKSFTGCRWNYGWWALAIDLVRLYTTDYRCEDRK